MDVVETEAQGPPCLRVAVWQGVCAASPGASGCGHRHLGDFLLLGQEQRHSLSERAGGAEPATTPFQKTFVYIIVILYLLSKSSNSSI